MLRSMTTNQAHGAILGSVDMGRILPLDGTWCKISQIGPTDSHSQELDHR